MAKRKSTGKAKRGRAEIARAVFEKDPEGLLLAMHKALKKENVKVIIDGELHRVEGIG
jgi:hypothetical protein